MRNVFDPENWRYKVTVSERPPLRVKVTLGPLGELHNWDLGVSWWTRLRHGAWHNLVYPKTKAQLKKSCAIAQEVADKENQNRDYELRVYEELTQT